MAVNATAIWRVRPSGSNSNGGGYDPGIASPGTDYSQQNAAQVTFDGVTITATTAGISATITISGYTPAATDVANAVNITGGTNFITGWYFIVSTGVGTWTLDRNCTTGAGAAMTGAMGGGWADYWTNINPNPPAVVSGNIIYILGSGTPNPASYTYDYDQTTLCFPSGGVLTLSLYFYNDPATPGYKAAPDSTGGMPVIKFNVDNYLFAPSYYTVVRGLWFVGSATPSVGRAVLSGNNGTALLFGCVFDQFGYDLCLVSNVFNQPYYAMSVIACEVFSSVSAGAGIYAAIRSVSAGAPIVVDSCNIHDCIGHGMYMNGGNLIATNNIIAKNAVDGIRHYYTGLYKNNTIDGNLGHGISNVDSLAIITNNIISNHTQAGKYGISYNLAAVPALLADFNVFYNNTTNTNYAYGPHDTYGGSNPYVGQSTENYTLA